MDIPRLCITRLGVLSGIFGGQLLGVRSVSGLAFYDWESLELVRRIEITPKHVYWSEGGTLVSGRQSGRVVLWSVARAWSVDVSLVE